MASDRASVEDMEKGMFDIFETEIEARILEDAVELEEIEKKKQEEPAKDSGVENFAFIDDEMPVADEAINKILDDTASSTKRMVSFKPETNIRIIITPSEEENQEVATPTTKSLPDLVNDAEMVEIDLTKPTPEKPAAEPVDTNHLSVDMIQNGPLPDSEDQVAVKANPMPDVVNDAESVEEIDNPQPMFGELTPESYNALNIAMNEKLMEKRRKDMQQQNFVQWGCVIVILVIVLLLLFAKGTAKHH